MLNIPDEVAANTSFYNKDGISLIDDVGGLGGFGDFLGTIYESENKEEKA